MKRLFAILILAVVAVLILDRLTGRNFAEFPASEQFPDRGRAATTRQSSAGGRSPASRSNRQSSAEPQFPTGRYLPPAPTVTCGARCGVERWQIKTLSDDGRSAVDFTPVPTTLEYLAQLPRPVGASGYARSAPVEQTTYQIDAYLGATKSEGDGDVHLILAGLTNQRATMIAEIPNPNCGGACASGLASEFAQARATLERILAEPNPNDEPIVVRVTGVGFFDRNHGQVGAAPNFIELHPVLKLERR